MPALDSWIPEGSNDRCSVFYVPWPEKQLIVDDEHGLSDGSESPRLDDRRYQFGHESRLARSSTDHR
jgi:hypothetical protein